MVGFILLFYKCFGNKSPARVVPSFLGLNKLIVLPSGKKRKWLDNCSCFSHVVLLFPVAAGYLFAVCIKMHVWYQWLHAISGFSAKSDIRTGECPVFVGECYRIFFSMGAIWQTTSLKN